MTDANGTRNNRISSTTPGLTGPKSSSTPSGAGSQPAQPGANTPAASNSSSGANSTSSNSPTGNSPTGNASQRPAGRIPSSRISTPGSPTRKARPQSRTDKPTRRTRRARNSESTEGKSLLDKRRLFGSGPDRIKSKSSSRTRALKAKTAKPTAPGSRIKERGPKKKTGTISTLGKAAKAAMAEKERPALPSPGYPGKVPPSRSLVRRRRRSFKTPAPVRIGIWLLIFGLGIAVLGGTLLQAQQNRTAANGTDTEQIEAAKPEPTPKSFPVPLNQEIPELKKELQELPNLYPDLTPKIFYVDVDTGKYASVEGGEAIAAASTIKLPILLAFFEEVDAGRIDLNQTMAIQPKQIAEGSGDMQIAPPGTQFTALEVATQMIINSDNTATNMMIDLLGGNEALNSRFKLRGLEKTVLNNPLPDVEGTNLTSARDLANTMLSISEGNDLSARSRDRILNILKRTYNKDLLAGGLEEQGALTYNKTGYIASILADVSLVDMSNGKRYVIAALVKRPDNDGRALELIRRISGLTFEEADKAIKPAVTPLGNPEEATSDPSTASGEQSESGTDAAPAAAPNQPEEEPYPSANPPAEE